MPYLPTRLPKLLALAASAAFSAVLLTGTGPADAAPGQALTDLASPALPVEQVGGYGRRHYRSYDSDYVPRDYSGNYRAYAYHPYRGGHDEIRELQRLFPSTNWPPSMRYNQY